MALVSGRIFVSFIQHDILYGTRIYSPNISATWEKLIKPTYRAHLFHQVSCTLNYFNLNNFENFFQMAISHFLGVWNFRIYHSQWSLNDECYWKTIKNHEKSQNIKFLIFWDFQKFLSQRVLELSTEWYKQKIISKNSLTKKGRKKVPLEIM